MLALAPAVLRFRRVAALVLAVRALAVLVLVRALVVRPVPVPVRAPLLVPVRLVQPPAGLVLAPLRRRLVSLLLQRLVLPSLRPATTITIPLRGPPVRPERPTKGTV